MKILYHHRIRSKDGQFVHIEELTNALRALGHEIVMSGPKVVETESFGSDAGIVAWLKKHFPKVLYELLEFAYGFYDFWQLYRAAKQHKPDCLYERYNLYTMGGIWVKRLCRLPMLSEVNSPIYQRRKRYDGISLGWLAKWTENYVWRRADFVLPVTQVLANIMISDGTPPEKIRIVPNGINTERFGQPGRKAGSSDAKMKLNLSGKTVLGFVGFMRGWHGLDMIVDLVCKNKRDDLHLLIVGDGPAREAVEAQARQAGASERITFTGIVGRDELVSYIAAFDIALQPDVVEYASPLKLFEYLAMGCAVVAPSTENIREILVHGVNALLFEPRNQQALRDAVEVLLNEPETRERLGQAAAQTIIDKGLLWSENAKRVVTLFEELGVKTN